MKLNWCWFSFSLLVSVYKLVISAAENRVKSHWLWSVHKVLNTLHTFYLWKSRNNLSMQKCRNSKTWTTGISGNRSKIQSFTVICIFSFTVLSNTTQTYSDFASVEVSSNESCTNKEDILFLKMLKTTQIFIHDKGGLSFKKGRAGKEYLTG